MSKFIADEVDVQIINRDDAGEFELEAFPITVNDEGGRESNMGLTLALDHETGELPQGVDDDRWLEVASGDRPDAPIGISSEVWTRFLDIAFGRLAELTKA